MAEMTSSELAEHREQDRFLPIANVTRIMKRSLPENAKIAKDAKETVQECVSEFIAFITSEASDKCQLEKRKTVNGDDILWALATLGFDRYIEPLKVYLAKYRESLPKPEDGAQPLGKKGVDGGSAKRAKRDDEHDHGHDGAMAGTSSGGGAGSAAAASAAGQLTLAQLQAQQMQMMMQMAGGMPGMGGMPAMGGMAGLQEAQAAQLQTLMAMHGQSLAAGAPGLFGLDGQPQVAAMPSATAAADGKKEASARKV